jgi:hypothetical protein
MSDEIVGEVRRVLAYLAAEWSYKELAGSHERIRAELTALEALLGLHLTERFFLADVSRLLVQHQPDAVIAAGDIIAVYADWLEDNQRPLDSARIRRLVVADGDVLLLKYDVSGIRNPQAARQFFELVEEARHSLLGFLASKGKGVFILPLNQNTSLENLGDDVVEKYGLPLPGCLRATLRGQPEDFSTQSILSSGATDTKRLLTMISRLKADNNSLRQDNATLQAEIDRQSHLNRNSW